MVTAKGQKSINEVLQQQFQTRATDYQNNTITNRKDGWTMPIEKSCIDVSKMAPIAIPYNAMYTCYKAILYD